MRVISDFLFIGPFSTKLLGFFAVRTIQEKQLKKRFIEFLKEAPVHISLGYIGCLIYFSIIPIFTGFYRPFQLLSEKEKLNWFSKVIKTTNPIIGVPVTTVASIGYILNSPDFKKEFHHFTSVQNISDINFAECFDFVIVGSGAGGASAAITLIDSGASVLLVEEGEEFNPNIEENIFASFRHHWRDFGMQLCKGNGLIPILQGKCLGGSSVVSGAIIHPFPRSVWDEWKNLDPKIAKEYKFSDISNASDELLSLINFKKGDEHTYKNSLLKKLIDDKGWNSNAMNRATFSCQRTENCVIGCRTGGKASLDKTLIKQFINKGGLVLTKAKVKKFKEMNDCVSVEIEFRKKSIENLKARNLILSAGVIHSAKILKQSGLKNQNLGKFFSCNISSSLVVEYDKKRALYEGPPMGLEITPKQGVKIATQSIPMELSATRLGLPPDAIRRLDYSKISAWAISIKSNAYGKINLGTTGKVFKISFNPSAADMKKLKDITFQFTNLLLKAGDNIVYPQVKNLPPRIKSSEKSDKNSFSKKSSDYPLGISHLFGGCVMSSSSESGVVDYKGKVHGLENIYVFDASIFPLSTGLNPQLSIMSIARLLAKKICTNRNY
jgi:choline dehydrogenase-like flavoprotein